ncbi:hypothetical protein IAQ61_004595 [Plenodomus lingam]|uniref:uncharacterized protein n=1 Tax=Leptosphaeria maculans TaxID=5022 RepID=UPI003332D120|nr:hypothetical protein IAQ61_004595 [Plenodomus lingam]
MDFIASSSSSKKSQKTCQATRRNIQNPKDLPSYLATIAVPKGASPCRRLPPKEKAQAAAGERGHVGNTTSAGKKPEQDHAKKPAQNANSTSPLGIVGMRRP